jgi:hypothetical protein
VFEYQHLIDFSQLRYGGDGDLNGFYDIRIIKENGCSREHFAVNFQTLKQNITNKIVVIDLITESQSCLHLNKALNAQLEGASVIFFANLKTSTTLYGGRIRYLNKKLIN